MYIPSTSPTLPRSNTFVVLELDPVTTVSHLRSPELTAACKEIKTCKYVAYCLTRFEPTFDPDVPYHSYDLYLVHPGKGPLKRARYANPEWSIPILPNTSPSTYGRSLDPGVHLPRNDCFISPSSGVAVRCTTTPLDEMPSSFGRLSEEEAVEVDRWLSVPDVRKPTPSGSSQSDSSMHSDSDKREDSETGTRSNPIVVREEASQNATTSSELHSPLASEASPDVELHSVIVEEPGESEFVVWFEYMEKWRREANGREADVGEDLESEEQEEEGEEEGNKDEIDMILDRCNPVILEYPVVKVSFDLSEAEQLNDPNGFFEELEQLEKIREELEDARRQWEVEEARRAHESDEEYFATDNRGLSSSTLDASAPYFQQFDFESTSAEHHVDPPESGTRHRTFGLSTLRVGVVKLFQKSRNISRKCFCM
ncbi:hypothetical protein Moror_3365 [Moniliophthora roreri MCA 2997]|uniref:Uncharacterized protein n=2 Tax=Moniliophthora roreri TaxID=221103 RepID=V2WJ94_MONRO|nr:hypothetical protein Moror_3365 [Moniliophthora roreri MCA 2997]